MYDGYAETGKPLSDEDIDVLENALDDLAGLSESAPDIISDIDGAGVLKQSKATLQINRSKKALAIVLRLRNACFSKTKTKKKLKKKARTIRLQAELILMEILIHHQGKAIQIQMKSLKPQMFQTISKYIASSILFQEISNYFLMIFLKILLVIFQVNGTPMPLVRWSRSIYENWFELKSGYGVFYVPDVKDLPEDYTIEFDLITQGIDKKTSSTARVHIILSDNNKFNDGLEHYVKTAIPLGQYGAFSLRVNNYFNRNGGDINTDIKADIRDEVLNRPHIAISVTKQRYRLWINEVKYVDIPRFIQELNVLKYLKFHINNFKDGKERVFITNLKVAEGGVDLRRKLLSEGSISTNGILFDSGSANIQPQSLGIVRQISQVLMQDENINLMIVGHTDSDGNDDANLKLSKSRAEAVKSALINIYKISGERLTTNGKGESVPVADNSTSEGKAQNRRVEFVKQ